MGATHFLIKGLEHVKTGMSLHVLAYNSRRLIAILGMANTIKAIRAFIHLRRLKTALRSIAMTLQKGILRLVMNAIRTGTSEQSE